MEDHIHLPLLRVYSVRIITITTYLFNWQKNKNDGCKARGYGGTGSNFDRGILAPMHRFFRWRERLQAAKDEKEVRALIAEYLLTIDPAVVKVMPGPCQEALAEGEVQSCAVALLHAELSYSGPEDMRELLHEAAHTFAAASVRVSRLRMEPIVPGE